MSKALPAGRLWPSLPDLNLIASHSRLIIVSVTPNIGKGSADLGHRSGWSLRSAAVTMMETDFGKMDDGAAVPFFTIAHPSGIQARVTNLGATLVSLQVPDRNGSMGEVVLGLPCAEDYLRHAGSYFGATVGRFAN